MTKDEQRTAIHAKIDAGERLTDAEVKFAQANQVCLWGSVNHNEYFAAKWEAEGEPLPAMPLPTDAEFEAYQKMTRRYA